MRMHMRKLMHKRTQACPTRGLPLPMAFLPPRSTLLHWGVGSPKAIGHQPEARRVLSGGLLAG